MHKKHLKIHSFLIKNSQQIIEGMYLNIIKDMFGKPTANIIMMKS